MITTHESVMERSIAASPESGCEVAIDDERWDAEKLPSLIEQVVTEALMFCGRSPSENLITVALTDNAEVRRLNALYRGIDKPTNVLSFPSLLPPGGFAPLGTCHLGDVLLSFETVASEAETEDKSLADHAAHLAVHGALHLCGFDHGTDAEATRMESVERAILARFSIRDPYGDSEPIELHST